MEDRSTDQQNQLVDKRLLSPQSVLFLSFAVLLLLLGACSYLYATYNRPSVAHSETPQVTPSVTVEESVESLPHFVRLALYNGTNMQGLTTRVDSTLKTMSSLLTQVTIKENASQRYTESLVIDISGKNPQAVRQLAAFSQGKVSLLPEGEKKPEGVDILLILGQSYLRSLTPTPPISPTP